MVERRAVLVGVAGAITISGCIGPSGDGGSADNGTDDGDSSTEVGGTDEPAGEIIVEGERGETVAVDSSARFEDGNIDEILIIEGSVTNDGEDTLSVDLTLGVEQFRREATTTLELGAGESGEFELRLESVYAPQFDRYTLTIMAE